MNEKYEKMKREDATHWLLCRHVMGISSVDYWMDCIVLKNITSTRLKILVFGERRRSACDHKKRIRYVQSWRVKPKSIATGKS